LDIWAVKVPCYDNYTAYRNSRGTLGGGVFILIQNNIIATEQPQYVPKRELDWVKIKLKKSKDLLIGAGFCYDYYVWLGVVDDRF
jgi:hypothetical protein